MPGAPGGGAVVATESLPIHPFLAPVLVALTAFRSNAENVPLSVALPGLVGTLLCGLVVYGLCAAALRSRQAGALVATPLALLFLVYGRIGLLVWEHMPVGLRFLGPHWLTALLALPVLVAPVVLTRRRARGRQELNGVLNVIAVVLVMFNVAGLLAAKSGASRESGASVGFPKLSVEATVAGRAPHVVLLVLDGLGSPEVLTELYDLDVSAEVRELEAMGFEVSRRAHSNYTVTTNSLASALNLQPFSAFRERVKGDPRGPSFHEMIAQTLPESEMIRLLRPLGYRTVYVSPGVFALDRLVFDERHDPARRYSEFDMILLSATLPATLGWLGPTAAELDVLETHRARVTNSFRVLPETLRGDAPKFVLCHILQPHAPFVFDAGGEPTDRYRRLIDAGSMFYDGSFTHHFDPLLQALYREGYRGQVRATLRRTIAALRALEEASDRPLVVIVTGDHGPGMGVDLMDPARSDLRERFAIFHAVRVPQDRRLGLAEDPGLTESLRRVMNAVFGRRCPSGRSVVTSCRSWTR